MSTDGPAFDRSTLVVALWGAVHGTVADRTQLAALAARLGASRASANESLASVVAELDDLESLAFEKFVDDAEAGTNSDPRTLIEGVQFIHSLCARMRRNAVTGYGRSARHDVVNAVGAARNAVILLEEDAHADERQRFHDIAKRNLQNAERLVRSQLADGAPDRDDVAIDAASRRNERDDVGRSSEGDHLDPRPL